MSERRFYQSIVDSDISQWRCI